MADLFAQQFTSNKKIEKKIDNSYQIKKKKDGPLMQYLSHFNREKI